ncbi:uncharacterized protein LOC134265692 isoform X2 [Saccostrea cucullata]|uniref:uncharacterized protein LOC134265692 isoform X2 n=1 Tax=Saccostrea cuccullata TaxID=36930 RepID=UPI002ED3FD15
MKYKGKFASEKKIASLKNLVFKTNSQTEKKTEEAPGSLTTCSDVNSWESGRRVVELKLLAEGLKECVFCKEPLHLSSCTGEKKYGLASILYINCLKCSNTNSVPTGKRHNTNGKGPARCFDINTKLAAAMINAGIGEQQVNNILAELNLPTIHHKTLKEREREVGHIIEDIAEQSCNSAIQAEILCSESGDASNPSDVDIGVSSDGGWQKRGTGRNYNSLSGHVTVMGKNTKKCLSYGIACKTCRKCRNRKSSSRKNSSKTTHRCRRNWSGSAKGMEPFLTVQCLKSLKEKGLGVKTLIMDDDTTTFVRAKKAISDQLEKCSDKSHIVRNFNNSLHKVKDGHKNFSTANINYFKKCFSYAIEQNKENVEGIRQNLLATVPHAFGDHSGCNEVWCGYIKSPDTYQHKSFPSGKSLQGDKLKETLLELFTKHAENAEKLANLGSSNANENLNQIIAKKAPKSQHYSGSDSLSFRVAAAISQKNEGHGFIVEVNKACCLSPGKQTGVRAGYLDRKRTRQQARQSSRQAKLDRLRLKEERQSSLASAELHEGTTYESGIDYAVPADRQEELVMDIPLPSTRQLSRPVDAPASPDTIIVADLETTGFSNSSRIIQIAAAPLHSEDRFNRFVQPANGFIPPAIVKLTGIEMHGMQMYYQLNPVPSCGERQAIAEFAEWLSSFPSPLIVAHNAQFDARILVSCFTRHGLTDMLKSVVGFSDTVKFFKKVHPNQPSYKLQDLAKSLAPEFDSANAHNAENDVYALKILLKNTPKAEESLSESIFSTDYVIANNEKLSNKNKNIGSFHEMITAKVLTKGQSSTLAGRQ